MSHVTEALAQYSVYFIYAAMALYAAAFVAFALDIANRGARATMQERAEVPSAVERRASEQAGRSAASSRRGTAVLERPTGDAPPPRERSSQAQNVGLVLTIIGLALHLVSTVLRGIAADRVPWANMWEFSLTGTLLMVAVFLIATLKWDVRFLGVFVTGLVLVLLGISTLRYYVAVVPLMPALQSYWLVIHVIIATAATGFFALGFALAVAQLLQARRERRKAAGETTGLAFLATLPAAKHLENFCYRINIVGFILWTFTLIAGAIWAKDAWGRYWGWDTKEVWTFIIWVLYAGYIHARATRGWSGTRAAWLAIVGFAAVMFNFGVVNVFFHGLHAYSGL